MGHIFSKQIFFLPRLSISFLASFSLAFPQELNNLMVKGHIKENKFKEIYDVFSLRLIIRVYLNHPFHIL